MEFVMVGTMLTFLVLAVLQFAYVLYVRNTLVDAAAEGARYAALADRSPAQGVHRSWQVVESALGSQVLNSISDEQVTVSGVKFIKLTLKANLPLIGVWGPAGGLEVTGHAAIE